MVQNQSGRLAILSLPPGVVRDNTEYGAKGRWWDTDLVRWYGAMVGPIGGWRRRDEAPVQGAARAIIAWRDNAGTRHIAIGTHRGLFAKRAAGTTTEITPAGYVTGQISGGAHAGFGQGPFGTGAFGVPRPDTGDLTDATIWDLDTFGERLVACANTDGALHAWDLDNANPAEPVAGAPTQCLGLVVTAERSLMAYGASGDSRTLAWSDLEDMTDWTPGAENQAGDFTLSTQGSIVRALRLGSQILILTTVDAHVCTYRRPPYVYGFERVGHGCGAISRGCAVAAGQMAMWWGRGGFWRYDGGAVYPLRCDLQDYLWDDLNRGQRSKIAAYHNSRHGEVTWLYPSASSSEVDAYVTYSYRHDWWSKGRMARGCGAEEGAFDYPLLVSIETEAGETVGYVYEHERGHHYDGAIPFAETGPIELGAGEQVAKVGGVIGDEASVGQVELGFRTRMFPNAPETTVANVALTARGEADLRFTARQVRMRIEGAAAESWRFGTARLRIGAGGGR